ncbi:MAG: ATP-binding protein [Bauldia sp.]
MNIQDVGRPVDQVEVKIGPQFLNLFSEHLYSSPNKAFEELVSNSWDAGARRVFISVPDNLQDDEAAIWVLDDGESMDVEGFRALWSVATSSKRAVEGADARRPIGKFGVGKLATYLLAHELTYVCKAADGIVRLVTMDYRRIDDDPKKGALHIDPIPLSVRELTSSELVTLLQHTPNGERALELINAGVPGPALDPDFDDEFGGKEPDAPRQTGTWTLVVMSSLKAPGRKLSVGWVKRLLRAALPLGDTISIYFNDIPLSSAKSNIDVVNEWIIGQGLTLGTLSLPDGEIISVEEHSSPYPHLLIEGIGPVTGRFRLYSDRITGGKSENIEVSNGFFVNIRGRVIKPEDPYFGLDNLSHSVWARFRATVRADGLDAKLSVNRESISDGRETPTSSCATSPIPRRASRSCLRA